MLLGLKRKRVWFLVNRVYVGTNPKNWAKKRKLLNSIGHHIGEGTRVVGPLKLYGTLTVGKDVWLGEGFALYGHGSVTIGDNCDVGPDVTCLTGSHEIGGSDRRAGAGISSEIKIGNGCWIGGRSTIIGPANIADSSVLAAGCVVKGDVPANVVAGGVPAKVIKTLEP